MKKLERTLRRMFQNPEPLEWKVIDAGTEESGPYELIYSTDLLDVPPIDVIYHGEKREYLGTYYAPYMARRRAAQHAMEKSWET